MEAFNRRLYRGGRPNWLAKLMNRQSAWMFKFMSTPKMVDTLEVIGRKSGKPIEMPVVLVHMDNARYLVSMLGDNTNWVRNVRAAGGAAALLKGGRSEVTLVEIPVNERAQILKRYCEIASGGRSHIPVHRDSPVEAFEAIAGEYPVFRIDSR